MKDEVKLKAPNTSQQQRYKFTYKCLKIIFLVFVVY